MLPALVDQAVVDLIGDDVRRDPAMALMVLSERRFPVGLDGELMRMARVFSLIRSWIASGASSKPSFS